jgi:hypothetical protein
MIVASLGSSRSSDIGSLFGNAIQGVTSTKDNARTNAPTANQPSDTSQLSPLAQFFSTLQQVLQSNPGQYQQLTQLIASGLNQVGQQSGNGASADPLSQLASDFSNAANTGNLPDVSNLANAIDGGGAGQQFQDSSLSIQVSFTEISANNAIQGTPSSSSNTPVGGTTSAGQASQQQFQEISLSYELDVTQSSTSGASSNTGAPASGQLLESQQLAALIEQGIQNAAKMAQSSGDSSVSNLLKQLAQDITNAFNGGSPATPQAPTAPSSSQAALQQLQESSLSYQINFSEGSTNGISMNQAAFSLSGGSGSVSAVF